VITAIPANATLLLGPMVNVVPLQLLAYEVARLRGCDVDQPRSLAKSVRDGGAAGSDFHEHHRSRTGEETREEAGPSALIGVVGLGYVGMPLALEFARAGVRVIGYDVDPKRVAEVDAR
jgi:hypothetical protein